MINLIVAMDKNNGIGNENKLLAHIGPDLKYFKNITYGNVVIMGYNTYMSLPVRPLKNRVNIVLTSKSIELPGAFVVNSINDAIKKAREFEKEIFICGGATVYKQFIDIADKLYVTHIFESFEADTFFPKISDEWTIENIFGNRENIEHKHPHVFAIYKKSNI